MLNLIATIPNKSGRLYDFYVGNVQGKAVYNLVPHGQNVTEPTTDGGYFDAAFIFKIKGF